VQGKSQFEERSARNEHGKKDSRHPPLSIAAAVVVFFSVSLVVRFFNLLLLFLSLDLDLGPAPRSPPASLSTKPHQNDSTGLPAALQRLAFAGRPLASSSDEDSLALLGVTDDSTLHCSLALLGGGKKRKKKTYTKPKKQKHKHRKVKLGVLKFFKVDDGGKVERLRQACPQCGPATFMAKHFDRVYCGKCHVTYMVEGGAAGGKGKKK